MTFEAIGQKLKSAREAQGLSLRQIYERTKIPINHLQALDTGQPGDLPEPVYVAGFIKRYAECIGLDGQILADEYRRLEEGNGNGKPKGAPQAPLYVTQDYLRHARIDNRAPSYKLWPFYGAIIVVFMVVLSWYSSQSNNNNQQSDTGSLRDSLSHVEQQTPAAPAGQPGTASVAGQPGQSAAPQTPGTQTAGSTNQNTDGLKLSANKHVWIQVKKLDSGETLFTGFLEPGQQRVFDEPKGLRVTAGNGASLSSEFKGKIETFGEAGKRAERVFAGNTTAQAPAKEHATTAQGPSTTSAGGTTSGSASGSPSTNAATGSTSANSATSKPKKPIAKKPDTQANARRSLDADGTRSIPGEDGTRSIDVPYRYSEGRLDSN